MKKYVKPELFYERYELSQHIADCAYEFKNSTHVESCPAEIDPKLTNSGGSYNGVMAFIDSNTACITKVQDYCYQTGADAIKTFVS